MSESEQRVFDATESLLKQKSKELSEALITIENLKNREHYLLEAIRNMTTAMTMMK